MVIGGTTPRKVFGASFLQVFRVPLLLALFSAAKIYVFEAGREAQGAFGGHVALSGASPVRG